MAYYYSFPYEFSSHGIIRSRERLHLGKADDFLVRQKVIELIKLSNSQFEDKDNLYIRAGQNGDLFFVINKMARVVITCRPISIEKQMSLSLADEY